MEVNQNFMEDIIIMKRLIMYIKSIPQNAKSIRKNQVQVDVNGNKVGNNRPDIQYDYEGKHYVIEIDNRKRTSTMHEKTIRQNDPKCEIKLIILE